MNWSGFQKRVFEIVDDSRIFPVVVTNIIVGYRGPGFVDPNPLALWKGNIPKPSRFRGLSIYENYLYTCDFNNELLCRLELHTGEVHDRWIGFRSSPKFNPALKDSESSSSTSSSSSSSSSSTIVFCFLNPGPPIQSSTHSYFRGIEAIDIYQNRIYVANKAEVMIFEKNQFVTSFGYSALNFTYPITPRCIKVNQDVDDKVYIFITFPDKNPIFKYDINGKLISRYGMGLGDLWGLTMDKQNIYVTEYNNHRITFIDRKTGITNFQFGFMGMSVGDLLAPSAIYLSDKILYVGDSLSLQLFTMEGVCLQRIGHTHGKPGGGLFATIYGIVEDDDHDRLYVSDVDGIQVFSLRS